MFNLIGVCGNDGVHNFLNRRAVRDLLQTFGFYDFVGTAAARPHGFEYFFRDLAGDCSVLDTTQECSKIHWGDLAVGDIYTVAVQCCGEFAGDPICHNLRVIFEFSYRRFEVVRDCAADRQYSGVGGFQSILLHEAGLLRIG